jgi:hypothetical protein
MCMKRYALICCLQEAKQLHSKQWARTSVEMAFEVILLPFPPCFPYSQIQSAELEPCKKVLTYPVCDSAERFPGDIIATKYHLISR